MKKSFNHPNSVFVVGSKESLIKVKKSHQHDSIFDISPTADCEVCLFTTISKAINSLPSWKTGPIYICPGTYSDSLSFSDQSIQLVGLPIVHQTPSKEKHQLLDGDGIVEQSDDEDERDEEKYGDGDGEGEWEDIDDNLEQESEHDSSESDTDEDEEQDDEEEPSLSFEDGDYPVLTQSIVIRGNSPNIASIFKDIVIRCDSDMTSSIVSVAGPIQVIFDHCHLQGSGFGISISSSSKVSLTRCIISDSSREGIKIIGAESRLTLNDTIITNTGSSGILSWGSTISVSSSWIMGTKGCGISLQKHSTAVLDSNAIKKNTMAGVLSQSSVCNLLDCQLIENGTSGAHFSECSSGDIKQCSFSSNTKNGLQLQDVSQISIESSSFKRNEDAGVHVTHQQPSTGRLSLHQLRSSENGVGFRFSSNNNQCASDSGHMLVVFMSDCRAIRSDGDGFDVSGPFECTISDCIASKSGGTGMVLNSDRNIVLKNCKSLKNSEFGFDIQKSCSLIENCAAEYNESSGFNFHLKHGASLVEEEEKYARLKKSFSFDIRSCTSQNNTEDGFALEFSFAIPNMISDVLFTDCISQFNGNTGFFVRQEYSPFLSPRVIFSNCDSLENGAHGYDIRFDICRPRESAEPHQCQLSSCSASDCGGIGFTLSAIVLASKCVASNCSVSGFLFNDDAVTLLSFSSFLDDDERQGLVSECTAEACCIAGFEFEAQSSPRVVNCISKDALGTGFLLHSFASPSLESCRAEGSGRLGFVVEPGVSKALRVLNCYCDVDTPFELECDSSRDSGAEEGEEQDAVFDPDSPSTDVLPVEVLAIIALFVPNHLHLSSLNRKWDSAINLIHSNNPEWTQFRCNNCMAKADTLDQFIQLRTGTRFAQWDHWMFNGYKCSVPFLDGDRDAYLEAVLQLDALKDLEPDSARPITYLRMRRASPVCFSVAAASKLFSSVSHLFVQPYKDGFVGPDDDWVNALVSSWAPSVSFPNMRSFTLRLGGLTENGINLFIHSRCFSNITSLEIEGGFVPYMLSDDFCVALCSPQSTLTSLTELKLHDNRITDIGVQALCANTVFTLALLDLSSNHDITDAGCEALASSQAMQQLQSLFLSRISSSARGCHAISRSANLSNIQQLAIPVATKSDEHCFLAPGTTLTKLYWLNGAEFRQPDGIDRFL